jgi:hypothetical protein
VLISPTDRPAGWKTFERWCKARGFLFAAPYGAGNDCPSPRRVRIVMDVLDDVRRNFATDPDGTYLAGFSGGARMACAVAFALPEHFGGVLSIGASGGLRDEVWLRQRVLERLSVAFQVGGNDFNRPEAERFRGPQLKGYGVRTRVWVQPGLGHAVPGERVIHQGLLWLEEAAPKRAALARRWPASRIAGGEAPDRAALAKALLAEGRKRLEKKETLYSGLMQLKGVARRWPDQPAAKEALKLLRAHEDRGEKAWQAEDVAEQRRYLLATARGLTAYATGALPAVYKKQRPDMARRAIALWEKIASDSPDSTAGKEARKRIAELKKLLGKAEP